MDIDSKNIVNLDLKREKKILNFDDFQKQNIKFDIIKLQDINSNWYTYKIEEFLIVNVQEEFNINKKSRLLLITCYPFDALLSGTPLRYIVSAINIDNLNS